MAMGEAEEAGQKPYHHGDLREALLRAAESALTELPIDKVSLREIARRAGVSHAAPKHHFGSLGALLGEVGALGFERFVATLDDAAGRFHDQSPTGRIQAMARAYLQFAADNPTHYALMFGRRGELERTPHYIAAGYAAWQQLETSVAAIVGPQRAPHGALAVWSACHGMAMLKLDGALPPKFDVNISIAAVMRMVLAGLQSDTGAG
jgi:AcrR family transcriptional regulator